MSNTQYFPYCLSLSLCFGWLVFPPPFFPPLKSKEWLLITLNYSQLISTQQHYLRYEIKIAADVVIAIELLLFGIVLTGRVC